jgi:hypothetical protein
VIIYRINKKVMECLHLQELKNNMKVIGKMIKFMDLGAFWIKMDKRKEVNGLMVKM